MILKGGFIFTCTSVNELYEQPEDFDYAEHLMHKDMFMTIKRDLEGTDVPGDDHSALNCAYVFAGEDRTGDLEPSELILSKPVTSCIPPRSNGTIYVVLQSRLRQLTMLL